MRPFRAKALFVLLLAFSASSGCAPQQPEINEAESIRLRTLLTTALDAWQAGQTAELASRQPAIRFADDDLAAGRRLLGYRLEDPNCEIAPFDDVVVALTLADSRGASTEKVVAYQISVEPALAVLRSEP